MKVKWWGHACFELKNEITIVFDPHDGKGVGLKPPETKADIILISHLHYDHADGADLVKKAQSTIIAEQSGEFSVAKAKIKGISSYHDENFGKLRGKNIIYVVEIEGLRFCHLGDLGHVPTDAQVKDIGEVDVLFVPVGGTYTIDATGATKTIEKIKPKIAVPMHYAVKGLKVKIAGVEEFLREKKNVRRLETDEFEITKEKLPKEIEIWVFTKI